MRLTDRWLLLAGAFAAGLFAGALAGGWAPFWPAAAALGVLVVFFGYGYAVPGWGYAAMALSGLSLAMSASGLRAARLENAGTGKPFVADVAVADDPTVRASKTPGNRWCSFSGEADGIPVRVIFEQPCDRRLPCAGETWRVAGWLERRPAAGRMRRTLWVKGAGTSAERCAPAGPVTAALRAVRRDLSRRMSLGLDHAPEMADLNRALILGERRRLSLKLRDTFVRAGTVHVFAVSGLHVMVLASLFFFFLRALFVPLRWARCATLAPLWAYVALIGYPPSAVRAAVMASICFFAPLAWRRSDALVAWALTFFAVHAVDPLRILDVGSGLSFTVMLVILLCVRALDGVRSRWAGAGITVAAWAAGVPIAAHVFGTFTPGGLLANLVLLPTAAAAVWAGALGAGLSYLSAAAAAHVNNVAALVMRAMVALSGAVASLPGASVEIAPWGYGTCAAWYVALFLALWLVGSVRARRGIL